MEALSENVLEIINFYTRLWTVPDDYDKIPTITLTTDEKLDYEQRWKRDEELLTKLLEEKQLVDNDKYYEKYDFFGFIDFRNYAKENPQRYQKLLKLSDPIPEN